MIHKFLGEKAVVIAYLPKYPLFLKGCRKLSNIRINQGGFIYIKASEIASCNINITSLWQDHCELKDDSNMDISVDATSNSCNLTIKSGSQHPTENQSDDKNQPTIDLTVPELCNIQIDGQDIHTKLKNKIMGDVKINCRSGNIEIDKIKGENLSFHLGKGDMKVNKVIEGSRCSIYCRSLKANMIHCNQLRVETLDVLAIEALYSSSSSMTSQGNIIIDLFKGVTQMISMSGDVFLRGIDGSFQTEAQKGRVELQINKLSPSSKSSAQAALGNVLVKVDPKVTAKVECRSVNSSSSSTRNSITITSNSFERLSSSDETTNVIKGLLNGKDLSPKITESNSGKIRISVADSLSLGPTLPSNNRGSSNDSEREHGSNPKNEELAELLLCSNAHIRLESLSWMDAIRQKHGFDVSENLSASKPSRLGRTGRAKQEALDLLK